MTSEAEQVVSDGIGRIMSFWGFRKNLGRIWAALYLSSRPLTSAELCDDLKLSTGSVSMALSELNRWGAIVKHYVPGDRRDHWIVEEDVWATVSRVMAQREAREIDQLAEALGRAQRAIDGQIADARARSDQAGVDDAVHRRRRVDDLVELAASGKDLLRLVLGHDEIGQLVRGAVTGMRAADPDAPRRRLIPRAPEES